MPQAAHKLHTFFYPRSIAIVGASRDEAKIGHVVLRNIIDSGFGGAVYPVNPNTKTVGTFTCYARYADIPAVADLAIVAIPAPLVPEAVEAIAKKGTKNILILSAGFKEIGGDGKRLEDKLTALADVYNLNILGPNCLGFVNTLAKLNATFGAPPNTPGNLRFISQSGAIASSIFDWVKGAGLGLEQVVTVGNKAVLGENDILGLWAEEAPDKEKIKTQVEIGLSAYRPIGMYLESIQDGEVLMDIAARIGVTHPIFLLKPGKSEAAQTAMHSHTGAMAGVDAVLGVALKHAGIIRCHGVEDLFDLSRAFAWENAPAGPRVAVVSNAGGPAVISTDALADAGLTLAPLSEKTQTILAEHLPRAASIMNPVDVLGDALADRYAAAIEAVVQESTVDALMIILTPQIMTDISGTAEVIGRLSRQYKKPIVCSFMGDNLIRVGEETLNNYRIPSFRFPERAVAALGKMWWWQDWRERESNKTKKRESNKTNDTRSLSHLVQREMHTLVATATREGRITFSNFEAGRLLGLAGITTPPAIEVKKLEQAETFAKTYGFPLVLKVSSPDILHKQDIGGVMTAIANREMLMESLAEMKKRVAALARRGNNSVAIELQQQVEKGVEVIVGIKRDPSFGPVLMVGAGGGLAELAKDTALAILPEHDAEILELLKQTRVYTLLQGYRGQTPYAKGALIDLIKKLIAIVRVTPSIKEIEINPVIVTGDAAVAVDGKVVLL